MKVYYILLFLLSLVLPVTAQEVTITLRDDTELRAEIINFTPQNVRWRLYPDGGAISDLPVGRIKSIDFPPTKEWTAAGEAMDFGNFNEAGRLYSAIARDRKANFYPLPGNYSSLALKRILECHRRLLNAKRVAEIAERLKPVIKTLPEAEREFSPEDRAWIAAGQGNWDAVVKITDSVPPGNTELSYLSGMANRALGNGEKSLDGFTAAYTLGFGSHPKIAKESLQASAQILASINNEDRLPELQAQLKIYRELFGKGKLWEEAPENFVKLADADLETIDFEMEQSGTVIPPMPELPPKEERKEDPWLYALEVDKRAYIAGQGVFSPVEDAAPQRKDGDYYFTGKESLVKGGLRFDSQVIRCQAIFIPEADTGVLFSAGKKGAGFCFYLEGGQAKIEWQGASGSTTFNLGPVTVGEQVILNFGANGKNKQLGGRVTPQSWQPLGKVEAPIASRDKMAIRIAPPKSILDKEVPAFKGVLRHIMFAFTKNHSEYLELERSMFDGNRIVTGVPQAK